jgi:uncharacterized protein (TIGR00369 family)
MSRAQRAREVRAVEARSELGAELQNRVQRWIVASPFGCVLGLAVQRLERDSAELLLPFRACIATLGDVIHGGAIAALIDVTATAAAWCSDELPCSARGTTVGFSVSFLQAARGGDLIARAQVVQRGSSICVCEVSVRTSQDSRAVARALVTYKLSAGRTPHEAVAARAECAPTAEPSATTPPRA